MSLSEAEKRAKRNYKKKIVQLYVELYQTDNDIIEHLKGVAAKEGKATYVKRLIREDIEKEKEIPLSPNKTVK